VLFKDMPFSGADQINGRKSQALDQQAELLRREEIECPASHRVVNIAFECAFAIVVIGQGPRTESAQTGKAQGTGYSTTQQGATFYRIAHNRISCYFLNYMI